MMTCKPNGMLMVHHNAGLGTLKAGTVLSTEQGPGKVAINTLELFLSTRS